MVSFVLNCVVCEVGQSVHFCYYVLNPSLNSLKCTCVSTKLKRGAGLFLF